MRKHLIAGISLLLPLAICLWVLYLAIELITAPLLPLAKTLLPAVSVFTCRLAALILLFLLTLIIGALTQTFLSHQITTKIFTIFLHIPVVKEVYHFCKQITNALLSDKESPFKNTALLPFPHHEAFAIGLTTNHIPKQIQEKAPHIDTAIFLPTAPHPISGLLLLTNKMTTTPIAMNTQDALKFIISCGVLQSNPSSPSGTDHA